MIDLKQIELKEWQERNFPRSRYEAMTKDQLIDMILAMQFTLGMAEEVGEVAHHILKGVQAIRGGINGFNINQIADGVVDSGVFGQQLLSHFGVDSEKETSKVIDEVLKRNWIENPAGDNKEIQQKYCTCLDEGLKSTISYDAKFDRDFCDGCSLPLWP